jgi:hypothetical protein
LQFDLLLSINSREASDAGEFHLKTKSRDFRVIFEIERERYRNIPTSPRICKLCNLEVDDELHFPLECPISNKIRKEILEQLENKFNKNIKVMLSRKRRTLHLTGFAYICCFIVDKTRSHNTKNVSQFLLCFRFLLCLKGVMLLILQQILELGASVAKPTPYISTLITAS